MREQRLRGKLHRELGPVVLKALANEKTIEAMVNPDGRVWWDRLGDGQSLLSDEFSAERAESLICTVAALLDTAANKEHPIVEGELPFTGFRSDGVVPPVAPLATAAIRKHRFVYDSGIWPQGAAPLVSRLRSNSPKPNANELESSTPNDAVASRPPT